MLLESKKQNFLVCIMKATDKKSSIRIWIRNPVYGSKGPDPYQNITVYTVAHFA
jgi:hypothetical protein